MSSHHQDTYAIHVTSDTTGEHIQSIQITGGDHIRPLVADIANLMIDGSQAAAVIESPDGGMLTPKQLWDVIEQEGRAQAVAV
jgi:hypothetical protein